MEWLNSLETPAIVVERSCQLPTSKSVPLHDGTLAEYAQMPFIGPSLNFHDQYSSAATYPYAPSPHMTAWALS